jgi:hypothetical protein
VVIKDPSIAVLSGVWFEAARLTGFDIMAVIAVRHPQEVVASHRAKTQVPPGLSSALWLKYSLLAERDTRGLPRVFVEYANLLDDWRPEVKRISAALGVDLNTQDEGAVEEFLKQDLHRQRHCGPVTEPFGTDWISAVYETLCAAARRALGSVCAGSRFRGVSGERTWFPDGVHRLPPLPRGPARPAVHQ